MKKLKAVKEVKVARPPRAKVSPKDALKRMNFRRRYKPVSSNRHFSVSTAEVGTRG